MPTSSSAFPRTRRCFSSRHISRALNAIRPQLTVAGAGGKVTPVIARCLPEQSFRRETPSGGPFSAKANIRRRSFSRGPHSFVICRGLAADGIVGRTYAPFQAGKVRAARASGQIGRNYSGSGPAGERTPDKGAAAPTFFHRRLAPPRRSTG